jgi:hypothetical protein
LRFSTPVHVERLGGDPASLTLIDRRLSRPQDLQLLFAALGRMTEALILRR